MRQEDDDEVARRSLDHIRHDEFARALSLAKQQRDDALAKCRSLRREHSTLVHDLRTSLSLAQEAEVEAREQVAHLEKKLARRRSQLVLDAAANRCELAELAILHDCHKLDGTRAALQETGSALQRFATRCRELLFDQDEAPEWTYCESKTEATAAAEKVTKDIVPKLKTLCLVQLPAQTRELADAKAHNAHLQHDATALHDALHGASLEIDELRKERDAAVQSARSERDSAQRELQFMLDKEPWHNAQTRHELEMTKQAWLECERDRTATRDRLQAQHTLYTTQLNATTTALERQLVTTKRALAQATAHHIALSAAADATARELAATHQALKSADQCALDAAQCIATTTQALHAAHSTLLHSADHTFRQTLDLEATTNLLRTAEAKANSAQQHIATTHDTLRFAHAKLSASEQQLRCVPPPRLTAHTPPQPSEPAALEVATTKIALRPPEETRRVVAADREVAPTTTAALLRSEQGPFSTPTAKQRLEFATTTSQATAAPFSDSELPNYNRAAAGHNAERRGAEMHDADERGTAEARDTERRGADVRYGKGRDDAESQSSTALFATNEAWQAAQCEAVAPLATAKAALDTSAGTEPARSAASTTEAMRHELAVLKEALYGAETRAVTAQQQLAETREVLHYAEAKATAREQELLTMKQELASTQDALSTCARHEHAVTHALSAVEATRKQLAATTVAMHCAEAKTTECERELEATKDALQCAEASATSRQAELDTSKSAYERELAATKAALAAVTAARVETDQSMAELASSAQAARHDSAATKEALRCTQAEKLQLEHDLADAQRQLTTITAKAGSEIAKSCPDEDGLRQELATTRDALQRSEMHITQCEASLQLAEAHKSDLAAANEQLGREVNAARHAALAQARSESERTITAAATLQELTTTRDSLQQAEARARDLEHALADQEAALEAARAAAQSAKARGDVAETAVLELSRTERELEAAKAVQTSLRHRLESKCRAWSQLKRRWQNTVTTALDSLQPPSLPEEEPNNKLIFVVPRTPQPDALLLSSSLEAPRALLSLSTWDALLERAVREISARVLDKVRALCASGIESLVLRIGAWYREACESTRRDVADFARRIDALGTRCKAAIAERMVESKRRAFERWIAAHQLARSSEVIDTLRTDLASSHKYKARLETELERARDDTSESIARHDAQLKSLRRRFELELASYQTEVDAARQAAAAEAAASRDEVVAARAHNARLAADLRRSNQLVSSLRAELDALGKTANDIVRFDRLGPYDDSAAASMDDAAKISRLEHNVATLAALNNDLVHKCQHLLLSPKAADGPALAELGGAAKRRSSSGLALAAPRDRIP